MGRLEGKVALITGSTSGMGATTARTFVREGARVVVCGRNEKRGRAIAEDLGEQAFFVRADVTVENDIANLAQATLERFGKIDCLFNNAAGGTQEVPVTEVDADQLASEAMNVFGSVVLVIKHILPAMREQGGASIINNGSTAAHRANSSPLIYSCLKAAVCHLTRCLAMELSTSGIRVNCISPGAIVTPIFAKQLGVPRDKEAQVTQALAQAMGSLLPAGRSGTGEDIANAAVYLASSESTFVTGQDLIVDGGLTGGLSPAQKTAQWQAIQQAVEPILAS